MTRDLWLRVTIPPDTPLLRRWLHTTSPWVRVPDVPDDVTPTELAQAAATAAPWARVEVRDHLPGGPETLSWATPAERAALLDAVRALRVRDGHDGLPTPG